MEPATLNGLISTAISIYPKKEVSFKTLSEITTNLYKVIKSKRLKTFVDNPPNNFDIAEAALSLDFKIDGNPNDRKAGIAAKAVLKLDAKKDSLLQLSLSYYKNQLASFLLEESIVTHAVLYLNSEAQK